MYRPDAMLELTESMSECIDDDDDMDVHQQIHQRPRRCDSPPVNHIMAVHNLAVFMSTTSWRFTTSLYSCQPRYAGSQPRCIHVNHVMPVHNLAVFMSTTSCRFTTSLYSCQTRHGGSQPRCIHVNHVMAVHNLAVFMSTTSWRFTTSLYKLQPHGQDASLYFSPPGCETPASWPGCQPLLQPTRL